MSKKLLKIGSVALAGVTLLAMLAWFLSTRFDDDQSGAPIEKHEVAQTVSDRAPFDKENANHPDREERPTSERKGGDEKNFERAEINLTPVGREFFEIWTGGETYKALADKLVVRARDGHAPSQFYLQKVLSECGRFVGVHNSEEVFEERFAEARLTESPHFVEMMKEERKRCGAFWKSDLETDYGRVSFWLPKSVESDFPPAVAAGVEKHVRSKGSLSPELKDKLANALESRNAAAIMEAKRVLSKSIRSDLIPRAATPVMIDSAVVLLACEYGYPCEEGGRVTKAYCDVVVSCGKDLGISEIMRRRLGSGQYDSMLKVKTAIKERLETGSFRNALK